MFIIFNIAGFLIFLFLFWKRLKEDYLPNQIFSTFFYILFFVLIFFFFSVRFVYDWWFWITFSGFLIGFSLSLLRFKLKFYETFEAVVLGFFVSFSLFLLGDSVKNLSAVSFAGFVLGILLIGFYQYIDIHYKNFSWYKSGKVGFCGLISFALFFLLRGLVFSFYPYVLSFVPKYEIFMSGTASFIFFVLTYNLSRSKE